MNIRFQPISNTLPTIMLPRRRHEYRRLLEMCGIAAGIGVLGGLAAFFLQGAIALATNLFFFGRLSLSEVSPADHHLGILVCLIPPLGGLLVGLMARYGSPAIRGHGIPETMETILVSRSRIAPRLALLKPLSTAISIGTGGPFGAEGPIIQTGGALGSMLGQLQRMTASERKVLIAAGAAAGMAATFNAPVAALFLAIELLLFEFRARSLLPVAIASIVATGLRWAAQGPEPLFALPNDFVSPSRDLPLFAILGACAGLLAVLLSRAVHFVENIFEKLPIHWMWWPALGGVAVGIVGFIFPQALGVGAEHLKRITAGDATVGFMFGMLVWKAFAWTLSLGSGTSGGVLGPLLLMGGALGGTLAGVVDLAIPGACNTSLWVVVSMASVFAGATRTPLTSVIFGLELTHQSNALLPLTIGCMISHLLALGLLKNSIMTEKISRRGLAITNDYELDALGRHQVRDVMTAEVQVVSMTLPLRRLYERFYGGEGRVKHQGYPVVDEAGRLAGIVTRSDMPRFSLRDDLGWLVVADVMSTGPVMAAQAEESLREAAERMLQAGVGRMPVVSADAPERIVGILSRSDILKALSRRADEENRRERLISVASRWRAAG
jgi:H+/Cl- antiporter ClcA/CBS domain-containing protein